MHALRKGPSTQDRDSVSKRQGSDAAPPTKGDYGSWREQAQTQQSQQSQPQSRLSRISRMTSRAPSIIGQARANSQLSLDETRIINQHTTHPQASESNSQQANHENSGSERRQIVSQQRKVGQSVVKRVSNRKEKIPVIGLDLGETSNNYVTQRTGSDTGNKIDEIENQVQTFENINQDLSSKKQANDIPVGTIFHGNDVSDEVSKADQSGDNTRRSQAVDQNKQYSQIRQNQNDLVGLSNQQTNNQAVILIDHNFNILNPGNFDIDLRDLQAGQFQQLDLHNLDYVTNDASTRQNIDGSGVSMKIQSGPSGSGSTLGEPGHSQNMRNAQGVFSKHKARGQNNFWQDHPSNRIRYTRNNIQKMRTDQMMTRQRKQSSKQGSESSQIRKVGSKGFTNDENEVKIRHIQLQKFPKSLIADGNKERHKANEAIQSQDQRLTDNQLQQDVSDFKDNQRDLGMNRQVLSGRSPMRQSNSRLNESPNHSQKSNHTKSKTVKNPGSENTSIKKDAGLLSLKSSQNDFGLVGKQIGAAASGVVSSGGSKSRSPKRRGDRSGHSRINDSPSDSKQRNAGVNSRHEQSKNSDANSRSRSRSANSHLKEASTKARGQNIDRISPLTNHLNNNWDQKNKMMEHLNEVHLGMVSKETLMRNKSWYKDEIEKHDRNAFRQYLTNNGKPDPDTKFIRDCKRPPLVLIMNDKVKGPHEKNYEQGSPSIIGANISSGQNIIVDSYVSKMINRSKTDNKDDEKEKGEVQQIKMTDEFEKIIQNKRELLKTLMKLKGQQVVQAQIYQFPTGEEQENLNQDIAQGSNSVESNRRKAFSQVAYRKPYHGAGQNKGQLVSSTPRRGNSDSPGRSNVDYKSNMPSTINSSKYKHYVKSKQGNLILVPGIPADAPGLMVFGKGQAAQRQRSYSRGAAISILSDGKELSVGPERILTPSNLEPVQVSSQRIQANAEQTIRLIGQFHSQRNRLEIQKQGFSLGTTEVGDSPMPEFGIESQKLQSRALQPKILHVKAIANQKDSNLPLSNASPTLRMSDKSSQDNKEAPQSTEPSQQPSSQVPLEVVKQKQRAESLQKRYKKGLGNQVRKPQPQSINQNATHQFLVENFRQSQPVDKATLGSGDTISVDANSNFQVTRRINVGQLPKAVKTQSSDTSEARLQNLSFKDINAQRQHESKEDKQSGQVNLADILQAHHRDQNAQGIESRNLGDNKIMIISAQSGIESQMSKITNWQGSIQHNSSLQVNQVGQQEDGTPIFMMILPENQSNQTNLYDLQAIAAHPEDTGSFGQPGSQKNILHTMQGMSGTLSQDGSKVQRSQNTTPASQVTRKEGSDKQVNMNLRSGQRQTSFQRSKTPITDGKSRQHILDGQSGVNRIGTDKVNGILNGGKNTSMTHQQQRPQTNQQQRPQTRSQTKSTRSGQQIQGGFSRHSAQALSPSQYVASKQVAINQQEMMLIQNYQGINEAKRNFKGLSSHMVKAGGFTQGLRSSKLTQKTVGLTIDMNTIYKKGNGPQDKSQKDSQGKNERQITDGRIQTFANRNQSNRTQLSATQQNDFLTATGISNPAASNAQSPRNTAPPVSKDITLHHVGDDGTQRQNDYEANMNYRTHDVKEYGVGTRGLNTEAEGNEVVDFEHQDMIYNLNQFNELNGLIESAQFSGRIAPGTQVYQYDETTEVTATLPKGSPGLNMGNTGRVRVVQRSEGQSQSSRMSDNKTMRRKEASPERSEMYSEASQRQKATIPRVSHIKRPGPHVGRLTSTISPVLGKNRMQENDPQGQGRPDGMQYPIPALNLSGMQRKTIKGSNPPSSINAANSSHNRSHPISSPDRSPIEDDFAHVPFTNNYDDTHLDGADDIEGPQGIMGGAKLMSPLPPDASRRAKEAFEEVSKDIGSQANFPSDELNLGSYSPVVGLQHVLNPRNDDTSQTNGSNIKSPLQDDQNSSQHQAIKITNQQQ